MQGSVRALKAAPKLHNYDSTRNKNSDRIMPSFLGIIVPLKPIPDNALAASTKMFKMMMSFTPEGSLVWRKPCCGRFYAWQFQQHLALTAADGNAPIYVGDKMKQEFVRPRWPYDMRPSARAEKYIRDAGP